MTMNMWIGLFCIVLAIVLAIGFLASIIDGLIKRSFAAGEAKGRAELESWWTEQEKQVEREREKIWREEG